MKALVSVQKSSYNDKICIHVCDRLCSSLQSFMPRSTMP